MNKHFVNSEDTIAAIATAEGSGGISVIRISGNDSFRILSKIFKRKTDRKLSDLESHRLYRGHIQNSRSEIIDDVLGTIMKSPNSYTGEDVVEIHCHGGYLVPRKILETIIHYGARPAQPGEFSFRAFLNGKIDLTQAEAIVDIVNSQTELGLKQAELQLHGGLSKLINDLKELTLDSLAEVEANVDFPEEDINPLVKESMIKSSKMIISSTERLISTFEGGNIIKNGVNTVIIGKPNVGKSSLLNRLLNKDRAIVSQHPGTTRDFIEETIDIKGIPLKLIDTAGIRTTSDEVEGLGVGLAKEKAKIAELIIAVLDSSRDLDTDDIEVLNTIKNHKHLLIANKSDLEQKIDTKELERLVNPYNLIPTSAKTGNGIEELKIRIVELVLGSGNITDSSEVILTEIRHKKSLEDANSDLKSFLKALNNNESPEFLAIDLRSALDNFGDITGETTTEDILGRIFSKFCIGK